MFEKILKNRQFWTFILAQVLSIASLVVSHYIVDPFALDMAKYFIGLVEGIAGFMIVAFTVEDTIVRTYARVQGIAQGVSWKTLINRGK